MNTRNRIWWAAACTILLGAPTLWVVQSTREPVHQGKRLTDWLMEVDYNNPDEPPSQKTLRATAAVQKIGDRALPHLVRMLQARDSKLKSWLMDLARRQKLVKVRLLPDWWSHILACRGLQALGPQAEPALPILTEFFHSGKGTGIEAVLAAIGSPAFPLLTSGLSHTNAETRLQALGAFHRLLQTEHRSFAVPILKDRAANGPDDWMKFYAAFGLARLHLEPDLVVPILLKTMATTGNDSAAMAAKYLASYPAQAKEHIAEIRHAAQRTNDPIARMGALEALRRLGAEMSVSEPPANDKLETARQPESPKNEN